MTDEARHVAAYGLAIMVAGLAFLIGRTTSQGAHQGPASAPCVCSCSFVAGPPVVIAPGAAPPQ